MASTPADSAAIRAAAAQAATAKSGCGCATTAKYGPDPSCQPCPDCGGLECLCRPRFFAGQLLTEQDLNRLDHYITGKHKLHNRHLFGSGVVCGLVATCAPCDERVNVSPGYALSPCGEDIVVCNSDSVDICTLIARCRTPEGPDCRPYSTQDGGCDDVEEDWVLAIRYAESPARAQTPIVGAASCSCGTCATSGCSCGGGGCSSGSPQATGSGMAAATSQPRLRRGAAPTCEPTLTCESYRYEVFRAPEPKARTDDTRGTTDTKNGAFTASLSGLFDNLDGPMAHRIQCCLKDLEAAIPAMPAQNGQITDADRQKWFRWACAVRSGLLAWLTRNGGTDCEAIDRLSALIAPSPALPAAAFSTALGEFVADMAQPMLEAALHCICSNILPACPPPGDPRVPLAVVTIRKRDCHIVKVCNWTPLRQHVLTFQTFEYWFGWLPIWKNIRTFIEKICCGLFDFNLRTDKQLEVGPSVTSFRSATVAEPSAAAPSASPLDEPVTADWSKRALGHPLLMPALATSLLRPQSDRASLTRGDLADMLLRRPAFATPEGLVAKDQSDTTARIADSGLVRALAEVTRGAGAMSMPEGMTGPMALMMMFAATSDEAADGFDVGSSDISGAKLDSNAGFAASAPTPSTDLEALKRAMAEQANEIAALRQRLDAAETAGTATPAATPKKATTKRTRKPTTE